jgi:hypothetical protein
MSSSAVGKDLERFPRLYGYAPQGENGKSILALGIIQLLLGAVSMLLGLDALLTVSSYGYVGYGFWCGMMVRNCISEFSSLNEHFVFSNTQYAGVCVD